ncbi:hypothetical protein KUTeg_022099, partial [Tegillarca granosa]
MLNVNTCHLKQKAVLSSCIFNIEVLTDLIKEDVPNNQTASTNIIKILNQQRKTNKLHRTSNETTTTDVNTDVFYVAKTNQLFEISIIGVLVTIGLKYVLLNTVNTKDNINFEFPSMKHDVKQCLRMGTDKLALDDIMNMKPINFLQNYKNPCFKDPKGTLKCLPYFMLIGLDKSGTTDLFFKIVKHPDVLKNSGDLNGKETLWWSWKRYGYGDGSVGDLWDFTGWPQIHQNRGLKEPKVLTPHLIKHLSPNTKFIIMLRDPIRSCLELSPQYFINLRLHSDFHYWHFDGTSSEDFHRQVLESIGQLNDCTQKYSLRNCVFDRTFHCNVTKYSSRIHGGIVRLHLGMYWVFLQEWLKVFPKDQFLILRMENFIKDSKSTLKRIFKFLEL